MDMLSTSLPFELLEDAAELASYQGWSEQVYRDMLAVRGGKLSEAEFYRRYHWEKAVLVLDMTGFTRTTIEQGELPALLRIVEAHQICIPVMRDSGAGLIRSFADDIVALFDEPYAAVKAAFEIHARTAEAADKHGGLGVRCCIGIGFGKVLKIGPNLAQGDEMNRASKLGEDIAEGGEVLVTENVRKAIEGRQGVEVLEVAGSQLPFTYYSVTPAH